MTSSTYAEFCARDRELRLSSPPPWENPDVNKTSSKEDLERAKFLLIEFYRQVTAERVRLYVKQLKRDLLNPHGPQDGATMTDNYISDLLAHQFPISTRHGKSTQGDFATACCSLVVVVRRLAESGCWSSLWDLEEYTLLDIERGALPRELHKHIGPKRYVQLLLVVTSNYARLRAYRHSPELFFALPLVTLCLLPSLRQKWSREEMYESTPRETLGFRSISSSSGCEIARPTTPNPDNMKMEENRSTPTLPLPGEPQSLQRVLSLDPTLFGEAFEVMRKDIVEHVNATYSDDCPV